MTWCCQVFKGWYEEAGQRGFSILVERSAMGEPQFILQYRVVDKGLEGLVSSKTTLSIVSDIHMQYCPWCGRRLAKIYAKNVDALIRPGFKVTIPGLDTEPSD